MKKTHRFIRIGLSFLLGFITICSLFLLNVQVQNSRFQDFEYITDNEGKITITSYTGNGTQVRVPAKIENAPVVALDASAFEHNTNLKKVVIEDGIEMIGARCFANCEHLHTILLPESLTFIDSFAFYDTSLKRIDLPKSISTINDFTFQNCKKLKAVYINSPQMYFYPYAFDGTDISFIFYKRNAPEGSFYYENQKTFIVEDEHGIIYFLTSLPLMCQVAEFLFFQSENVFMKTVGLLWLGAVAILYLTPFVLLYFLVFFVLRIILRKRYYTFSEKYRALAYQNNQQNLIVYPSKKKYHIIIKLVIGMVAVILYIVLISELLHTIYLTSINYSSSANSQLSWALFVGVGIVISTVVTIVLFVLLKRLIGWFLFRKDIITIPKIKILKKPGGKHEK